MFFKDDQIRTLIVKIKLIKDATRVGLYVNY